MGKPVGAFVGHCPVLIDMGKPTANMGGTQIKHERRQACCTSLVWPPLPLLWSGSVYPVELLLFPSLTVEPTSSGFQPVWKVGKAPRTLQAF